MAEGRKISPEALQQRWLRDFTSEQQTYVPEAMAKPARMCEGFELRADGTYSEITSGADDRTLESEGTWRMDDAGTLTLSPDETSGVERKIHVIQGDAEKLIVEE